jgi:hypothetical protein
MSEWTPSTHEVARAVSFYKVVPRHEDEDFASWLGRSSMEGFMAQVASEEAFHRWLAEVKADVLSGWAGWFELNDSHVGGKQTFTAYEVAELLRGPEPFGFTATNHEKGVDDE